MPTLIEQVRVADAVGFDAFSMGDHYNIPGLQRLNQVPALARLCAEAKHCAVGTAVTLLGLRHPVTVASELASLDVLNEGKSFAAFGLGYREEELNAFNLTESQRYQRFVEAVEIVRRLWTEDNVSFEGIAFKLKNVTVDPKPLQKPRPPIWIAANTDAAVKRAASIGDGWMIGPHSAIDELERQVQLCRTAWTDAGKSNAPVLPIIRELGLANVAAGLLGILSLFDVQFLFPIAIIAMIFYGGAGIGHVLKEKRNTLETTAMISDLAASAVFAAYVVYEVQQRWPLF